MSTFTDSRTHRGAALLGCLLLVPCALYGQSNVEQGEPTLTDPPGTPPLIPTDEQEPKPWLDRTRQRVFDTVWRSGMRLDRLFGADEDEHAYQEAAGSIAPALLWDEFDGFRPKLRFRVSLPLPQLDERFNAFIGRVNREEYVTERTEQSGRLPRQYGPIDDDQTLLGIRYREPERAGHFDADAGVRLRFPPDPFVKGAYRYELGALDTALLTLRETVFWQNSEGLGFTSRADVEHFFNERWLLRWTGSGTISQESQGVRGYSTLSALRALPERRAVAAELFVAGEQDHPVPLREYGVKVAYRQSVLRDWLILEVRTSLAWPKEELDRPREPSWGVGMGFEMYFGEVEFSARPITF